MGCNGLETFQGDETQSAPAHGGLCSGDVRGVTGSRASRGTRHKELLPMEVHVLGTRVGWLS